MGADEKTNDDAAREAAAWLGVGSAAALVADLLGYLKSGQFDAVRPLLDPEYSGPEPEDLDYAAVAGVGPGWSWSGRPRLTDEGDAVVLRACLPGSGRAKLIDSPKVVRARTFVVRHHDDGWRLLRFGAGGCS